MPAFVNNLDIICEPLYRKWTYEQEKKKKTQEYDMYQGQGVECKTGCAAVEVSIIPSE